MRATETSSSQATEIATLKKDLCDLVNAGVSITDVVGDRHIGQPPTRSMNMHHLSDLTC